MCFWRSIVITWEFEFFIERFLVQWFSSTCKVPLCPLLCRSVPWKGSLPSPALWPALTSCPSVGCTSASYAFSPSRIMIHFFLKPELLLHARGKREEEGRAGIPRPVFLSCPRSSLTRPEKERFAGCCQCSSLSSRHLAAKIELSSEANLHGNYFRSLVLSLYPSV